MTTTPTFSSLFNPGKRKLIIFSGLAFAIILWCFLVGYGALSVSKASALGFALIILALTPKWLDDIKVWGASIGVLGIVITLQLLHLLEHGVQMIQFYRLSLPAGQSLGLISALNVEWVHFTWNWLVWGLTLFLVIRGMRNFWAYVLLSWATLHSLEHTYLLVRYLQVLGEMGQFGLPTFSVTQALPGVLGRNGWLALSEICGRIPGLTTAPRAVIHFWWNMGEVVLLLLAAWGGTPKLWSLSKASLNAQQKLSWRHR
jgi:hypothetical protein